PTRRALSARLSVGPCRDSITWRKARSLSERTSRICSRISRRFSLSRRPLRGPQNSVSTTWFDAASFRPKSSEPQKVGQSIRSERLSCLRSAKLPARIVGKRSLPGRNYFPSRGLSELRGDEGLRQVSQAR